MSKENSKYATPRPIDDRSFTELWYSLPKAGQQVVMARFAKHGIKRQHIYKWLTGSTPTSKNMTTLRWILSRDFGLRTRPEILFPGKKYAAELLDRFRPKWDGKVNWPSLHQDGDNETGEDEI